jgi:hypothetical protein
VIARANGSDRIILFTLVDLLVQIIFFAFLLFAVNRATQGNVQDRVAELARKFGIVSVTRFLEATSKLVAISELGRVDLAPASDDSKTLDDATKVIEGLDPETLRALSRLNAAQLHALTKSIAALSPQERRQLTAFIGRYGMTFLRPLLDSGLTAAQLETLLSTLAKLPPGDRGKLIQLGVTFAKVDPAKRQKIVEATAVMVRPTCFDRRQALEVTEVPNGYRVRALIPAAAADVARLLGGRRGAYTLTAAEFSRFASAITSAHADCTIRVLQRTETNDERQLKAIQYWFATW